MTKEEILAKHSRNYKKTIERDEKTLYDLQLNGFEAINAMDEYAEQEAVAFVKWWEENTIDRANGKFYLVGEKRSDAKTIEQLYQLYKTKLKFKTENNL